jgi:uncharacterized membrane protein YqjE
MKIALALLFAVGLLFSLFLFIAIGMAVGERAANVFGACVLVAAVMIIWSWRWFESRGEP